MTQTAFLQEYSSSCILVWCSWSANLILVVDHPNLLPDLLHDGGHGQGLIQADQGALYFACQKTFSHMLRLKRHVSWINEVGRVFGSWRDREVLGFIWCAKLCRSPHWMWQCQGALGANNYSLKYIFEFDFVFEGPCGKVCRPKYMRTLICEKNYHGTPFIN